MAEKKDLKNREEVLKENKKLPTSNVISGLEKEVYSDKFAKNKKEHLGKKIFFVVFLLLGLLSLGWVIYSLYFNLEEYKVLYDLNQKEIKDLKTEKLDLEGKMSALNTEYAAFRSIDQIVRSDLLEATISAIEKTYVDVVDVYEQLLDLKDVDEDTEDIDKEFADVLVMLSKRNYASASAKLLVVDKAIITENKRIASIFSIPKNVVSSNDAPGSGYSRQKVTTSVGTFMVDLVAGDLSSTRVIVDTASGSDCGNDCPTLSLADYVSRNGAYAGINGSYFCPASYPSCAGKTNSFDTLLMNKDKVYFNSDNNVYSTVPAVIFGGGWVRFVGKSQEWGRDTGIDSMIANQPLIVLGGNNVFGGDGDPKKGSKAGRSFVANKGNIVYIGVVWSATVAEAGHVLSAMGMDNALNLDSGGSTAFWSGGYKAGPGRGIPNAILFARK